MQIKKCINCGNEYHTRNKDQKYCSLLCFNSTKKGKSNLNISKSTKGRIPWNKGKKGLQIAWNKNLPRTNNEKENISRAVKNAYSILKINPHSGIHLTKETREKIGKANLGKIRSEVFKQSRRGKNNPNWNNGSSFTPYCLKFNSKLKESIRNRDNYICQLCDKTQEEEGKKLSVHHIHYDKENCNPDLITLCGRCNTKVNGNRDYWEKVFMNKLNERLLLFYNRRD